MLGKLNSSRRAFPITSVFNSVCKTGGLKRGLTPSRLASTVRALDEFKVFNPSEEHTALRLSLRRFVKSHMDPHAIDYNREEKFKHSLFLKLGWVLGLMVEKQYGGLGMDVTATVIAAEEFSASDPSFAMSVFAQVILFSNNLAQNGSHEQKLKYLPEICAGTKIGGMAMSEPNCGSDVLAMETQAVRSSDGRSYVMNGSKMWITNGAVSDTELGDVFLVYARTGATNKDVSLFLVEKGTPGFKLGQRIKDKCGMRASPTAELVFEDCVVPAENLVGGEGGAVLCMMRNLEIERLGLAAMSLGIARRSLEVMEKYAQERKAFGKPLNYFGQTQRHIADSFAQFMAGRCYVYNTAADLDLSSTGNRVHSDGVKLYCAGMAKNVADRAVQVLGGNGYVAEYQVERLWRDAKLIEIGGGTNEAHHKNITRDLSLGQLL